MHPFRSIRNSLIIVFFLVTILVVFGHCALLHPKQLFWAVDYQLTLPETNALNAPNAVWHGCERFLSSLQNEANAPEILWKLVSLNGEVCRLMDQRVNSSVMKLNNGFLIFHSSNASKSPVLSFDGKFSENEISETLTQLWQFNDFLKSQGIPLIYVNFPHKIHKTDPQLPRGVLNPINAEADYALDLMRNQGIEVYDARNIFLNQPDEHYRLFFRGDHHWKPEYAFITFQHLAPIFAKYGAEIPAQALAAESWNSHGFSEPFSYRQQTQTRRTGKYYIPLKEEDSVRWHYTPLFPTDLTLIFPTKQREQRGSFQEIELSNYLSDGRKHTVNHRVPHTKVLLLKDSFSLPLFDFLALSFHEVDMVDLRYFEQSLPDYVKETHPDIVVIAHRAGIFESEGIYKKHLQFMNTNP